MSDKVCDCKRENDSLFWWCFFAACIVLSGDPSIWDGWRKQANNCEVLERMIFDTHSEKNPTRPNKDSEAKS